MNRHHALTRCLVMCVALVAFSGGAFCAGQSISGSRGKLIRDSDGVSKAKEEEAGPHGSLLGRIVDWQGNPIPGALVHVEQRPFLIRGMLLMNVDDLTLGGDDTTADVETVDSDGVGNESPQNETEAPKAASVPQETAGDAPAEGETGSAPKSLPEPVETDIDGVFRIDELAPGHYTLVVDALGFPLVAQPGMPITENRETEVRLVLRPAGSLAAQQGKLSAQRPRRNRRDKCSDDPKKCK